jgi:drug/metabolite transporter (DMT)-like permease
MVAVFAGWLFLGENLGVRQLTGSIVLLAGLVIARRRPLVPGPESTSTTQS